MDQAIINALIEENRLDEAIAILDKAISINNDDDAALFARGRIFWRQGRRGEAISDYTAATRINPDSPAAIALEQAHAIMDFYNPDLLNP